MSEDIFSAEKAHFDDTLAHLQTEGVIADEELSLAYDSLRFARESSPESLPFAELNYSRSKQKCENIRLAKNKPYFTRIDFAEDGHARESIYIGKHGIIDSATHTSFIFDWRAPISDLYYSANLGRTSYVAPAGEIKGELYLKRRFEIEHGELKGAFDTDIVSEDTYLQKALSAMSGDRLKDIVSTIQSEQYDIIRKPLNRSIIVQGAAGSGKTTIALHRIAYLLYAYSDRLRSERMLILAPSPLFLNYISGVLPDLGVESVCQDTYLSFMRGWLGFLPRKIYPSTDSSAKYKGSLRMLDKLNAFLDRYEKRITPENGAVFGPVRLFTHDEMEKFLLEDEAGFPMERRLIEFSKQLTKRAKAAAATINKWMESECERRAELFKAQINEKLLLREKLSALFASRDARVKETEKAAKTYADSFIKTLPSMNPLKIYAEFMDELAASDDADEAACGKYTTKSNRTETADVAALGIIAMRVKELDRHAFRHIVIDEAQDLSPMQISLLHLCVPDASFTIVGDLMQGIDPAGGTDKWSDISDGVFNGACTCLTLSTSYRSTRQIMSEAFRVSSKLSAQSKVNVIRDGLPVIYDTFKGENAQAERIKEALASFEENGFHSACVVCESAKEAEKLSKRLIIPLLDPESNSYETGIYISSAKDVKGLEFDACVIADASLYDNAPAQGRLLYVAMTRALHENVILSSAKINWL